MVNAARSLCAAPVEPIQVPKVGTCGDARNQSIIIVRGMAEAIFRKRALILEGYREEIEFEDIHGGQSIELWDFRSVPPRDRDVLRWTV